jgi:hypothetical protein
VEGRQQSFNAVSEVHVSGARLVHIGNPPGVVIDLHRPDKYVAFVHGGGLSCLLRNPYAKSGAGERKVF